MLSIIEAKTAKGIKLNCLLVSVYQMCVCTEKIFSIYILLLKNKI